MQTELTEEHTFCRTSLRHTNEGANEIESETFPPRVLRGNVRCDFGV